MLSKKTGMKSQMRYYQFLNIYSVQIETQGQKNQIVIQKLLLWIQIDSAAEPS